MRPAYLNRLLIGAIILAAGLVARHLLLKAVAALNPPNWHVFGPDIFYVLSGIYEPTGQALVALAALTFVVVHLCTQKAAPFSPNFPLPKVALVALVVFSWCFWGTSAFYHRFPLSLDENAAFFQMHAFLQGHIAPAIPTDLLPYKHAIVPEFIERLPDNTVTSSYFPIYASLLALGSAIFGTPWVVNPLLAAGAIFLVYGVAQNLNVSKAFTGWAVVLLATSSQFLVNGMSAYAMTSHLFFSLAWLYFYTHPNRRFYYVCPWLGVLAMGLHNPFPHTWFVLPFLFRLLLDRRWSEVFYSIVVYLAGGILWICWMHATRPEDVAMAEKAFVFPGAQAGFIFILSMLVLMSWQNFLTIVFFVAALFRARRMPPFFVDLLAGLALTMIFYMFYTRSQGAGWGYRYMHQVLGNLVLVAAWGAAQYSISRITFAVVTAIALLVQMVYRCNEASEVVGRQAASYAAIAHMDADYVILERSGGWSVQELVRNDPDFKNRPIVLFRGPLSGDQFHDLMDNHKAVYLDRDELAKIGVPVLKK